MSRVSFRPILLTGFLLCALVLLAVLQYQWSGQISEAERLRMNNSLQNAVDQFRLDFAREILVAGTGLQADSDVADAENWPTLAQAQAEWLANTSSAHLVKDVYLLLSSESPTKVLRLNASKQTYEPVPTPSFLKEAEARLGDASEERRPGPPRNSAWAMDGDGPFLIHALTHRPHRQHGQPVERRTGFQVIALDREYISGKLLPALALHHFSGAEGLVYQAEVYSGDASQSIIYNSSNATPLKAAKADIETFLVERRPRGPGGPERGPRERPFGFRDWQRRDGARNMPFNFQRALNTPLLVSDGVDPWKLAVRHRSGSVDTAVQTLRWRNLSISFVILLVLGASIVVIVSNTRRAQRLAELQMEFVAGVSHELRTPLSVISSAAENLTDGVVEEQGQVKQYGSLIRNESRRLTGMMEQILQFAAGQKRTPYKPVTLDVEELVDGALGLSQSFLTELGITVDRDISPALPPVRGESGALTQCLQNLISNAAKYSGESRWVGIRAAHEGSWVSVSVADRGIGIEKSDLPHLFDAFFRAKTVRSAQIHGTGLGLNLARRFARDAGGDLTVESAIGHGSKFTLRLPADVPDATGSVRLVDQTI